MTPPLIAVVGATATGKSALAVDLAQRLGAQIVNADSMQLYRGMDIGTAKPTMLERGGIVHHMFDLWDVRRTASVAEYRDAARARIEQLRADGAPVVLVGGSGLYVRAVLDRIDFPGTDPEVRARFERELAERGPRALHDVLAQRDPAAAAAIGPDNGRRIVRALEVVALRGSFSATLPSYEYALPDVVQVGLRLDRTLLDATVEQRVLRMIERGLLDEVRALLDDGLREGRTASRALGYAQLIAHLDGRLELDDAVESTIVATRRFVRRQESWFGRDPRIHWLDAAGGADAAAVERLLDSIAQPAPPSP